MTLEEQQLDLKEMSAGIQESMYAMTGLYFEQSNDGESEVEVGSTNGKDKSHTRTLSSGDSGLSSLEVKHHKRTLSNSIHELKTQNKLNSIDLKKHTRSSSSGYQEIRPRVWRAWNGDTYVKCHKRGTSFSDTSLKAIDRNDIMKSPKRVQSFSDYVIKCHSRNPSGCAAFIPVAKDAILPPYEPANEIEALIEYDCGILNCRPPFIQSCASIKVFVFLLSFMVILQQALSSGYINSVITTIEKRFEISSSLSGLIASSYEIGNVLTVIFVSYLGSTRHIPTWIGIGSVIMGIGSLIFVIPHFIAEAPPDMLQLNETQDNICRSISLRTKDMNLERFTSGLPIPPLSTLVHEFCIKSQPSTTGPVVLFILAQFLLGSGGSPLLTLGTTYIDDHVRSDSASMYIGVMYATGAFGPVLGFLLGAWLLSFHMSSFDGLPIKIESDDPRWIGMWWGGFLLCGILLILVAIPFFAFPKTLVREKEKLRFNEKTKNEQKSNKTKSATVGNEYGRAIKDIPYHMWRLLTNPVYILTCLGACMELMIVSGFVVFLPKYLETQFSLGKSQASVYTGSIAIPGACVGIFMGGLLLKKYELTPKGAIQFIILSNILSFVFYILLFSLGCDNVKMAGTTIPYNNSSSTGEAFQVNLDSACNDGCGCGTTDVEPVCGRNGVTYFSPCHAGCTEESNRFNYSNCACVKNETGFRQFAEVYSVPVATAGPCVNTCNTIYPFLIILFFMTFLVATTQMPLLMIVLRSVDEEERSLALGMQFVIFRLFGYIPAPISFGNMIDSTCLFWKTSCGERGGRCLLYDIVQFRYKYVGLCTGIKILALALFLLDWWVVRRRVETTSGPPLTNCNLPGSIISIDKLFDEKQIRRSNPVSRSASSVSEHNKTTSTILTNTETQANQSKSNQNGGSLEELELLQSHNNTNSQLIPTNISEVNELRLFMDEEKH